MQELSQQSNNTSHYSFGELVSINSEAERVRDILARGGLFAADYDGNKYLLNSFKGLCEACLDHPPVPLNQDLLQSLRDCIFHIHEIVGGVFFIHSVEEYRQGYENFKKKFTEEKDPKWRAKYLDNFSHNTNHPVAGVILRLIEPHVRELQEALVKIQTVLGEFLPPLSRRAAEPSLFDALLPNVFTEKTAAHLAAECAAVEVHLARLTGAMLEAIPMNAFGHAPCVRDSAPLRTGGGCIISTTLLAHHLVEQGYPAVIRERGGLPPRMFSFDTHRVLTVPLQNQVVVIDPSFGQFLEMFGDYERNIKRDIVISPLSELEGEIKGLARELNYTATTRPHSGVAYGEFRRSDIPLPRSITLLGRGRFFEVLEEDVCDYFRALWVPQHFLFAFQEVFDWKLRDKPIGPLSQLSNEAAVELFQEQLRRKSS